MDKTNNRTIFRFLFMMSILLLSVAVASSVGIWNNRSYFFDGYIFSSSRSVSIQIEQYCNIVKEVINYDIKMNSSKNDGNIDYGKDLEGYPGTYYVVKDEVTGEEFSNIPENMAGVDFNNQENIYTYNFYADDFQIIEFVQSYLSAIGVDLNESSIDLSGSVYVNNSPEYAKGAIQTAYEEGFQLQKLLYIDLTVFALSSILSILFMAAAARKALPAIVKISKLFPIDMIAVVIFAGIISSSAAAEYYILKLKLFLFLRSRLLYEAVLVMTLAVTFAALSLFICEWVACRKEPFAMKKRIEARFSRKFPVWLSCMISIGIAYGFLLYSLCGFKFKYLKTVFSINSESLHVEGPVFLLHIALIVLISLLIHNYVKAKNQYGNAVIKSAQEIADGKFENEVPVEGSDMISILAQKINIIKEGYNQALKEQRKSEKLKYELVTNISHDLRTPLTSVMNYINILKEKNKADALNEYICQADANAKKLNLLVEDLFSLSKIESGNIQLQYNKVNIVLLIKQVCHEFKLAADNENTEIILTCPRAFVEVECDAVYISRLFDNLVGNAVKYSMPGTRIYIEIDERPDRKEVVVIIRNVANYRMNFISEDLFLRFKRGDESRSSDGSGLGLAIAKGIVTMHGGSISLETEGDLFRVIVALPK